MESPFSPVTPSRPSQSKKPGVHADGYAWVKYGEKKLTPSNMIREYYRCKSWRDPGAGGTGCPAKKVVDRPCDKDEGAGDAEGAPKKRARAVFPRHSPCQTPEYSQHNHPPPLPVPGFGPTLASMPDVFTSSAGGAVPAPSALLHAPLIDAAWAQCKLSPGQFVAQSPSLGLSPMQAPGLRLPAFAPLTPQVSFGSQDPDPGPSCRDAVTAAVLSNCFRALASTGLRGRMPGPAGNRALKAEEGNYPSSSRLCPVKRPALPPLLIPDSVPEASGVHSPEGLKSVSGSAKLNSWGTIQPSLPPATMLMLAAAQALQQQNFPSGQRNFPSGQRDCAPSQRAVRSGDEMRAVNSGTGEPIINCHLPMDGSIACLVQQLLPERTEPQSCVKRKRLHPQSQNQRMPGFLPTPSSTSSEVCSVLPPSPSQNMKKDDSASGLLGMASSLNTELVQGPLSPSSLGTGSSSLLKLSELPDDVLLSLLVFLSNQIAGTLVNTAVEALASQPAS